MAVGWDGSVKVRTLEGGFGAGVALTLPGLLVVARPLRVRVSLVPQPSTIQKSLLSFELGADFEGFHGSAMILPPHPTPAPIRARTNHKLLNSRLTKLNPQTDSRTVNLSVK